MLRREDPYLKVGEVNDRAHKGASEYVWPLKDINFKVEQGDVVGIIGRNGAGKSTLLKLLSRVTAPTTGRTALGNFVALVRMVLEGDTIRARGRIASLLEVGTGFHPEMTGRENIYMNGAIMGMTRAEITRKLDEIVDFSGCERYLDTPVKRYSSGMTVRLGFAIAAHLEPEILVVDEVLAVGDAEFQKKAIGKMQDVSRGEGRTVLFVSHNMGAVKNLCKRGIVLNQGQVAFDGSVEEAVGYYLKTNICNKSKECILEPEHHLFRDDFSREIEIEKVALCNKSSVIASDEPLEIDLWLKNNNSSHKQCQYTVYICDELDNRVEAFYTSPIDIPTSKQSFKVHLSLIHHDLYKGFYKLRFITGMRDFSSAVTNFDATSNVLFFEVRFLEMASKVEYSVNTEWFKAIYRKEPFIRAHLMDVL